MPSDALETFASQWLERSLDDNAIRRMNIPEMFLLTDAILILLDRKSVVKVFRGIGINGKDTLSAQIFADFNLPFRYTI